MNIRRTTIGTTAGHAGQGPTRVDAYSLDTEKGLAVTVWTYGATLVELLVPDRDGRVDNVVVRLPDLESYEDRSKNPYIGSTLGRFARAVAGGRFELDGVEHQLDRNYGRHHFHGGSIGFDRFVWSADAERRQGELALRLRLERPDGDQGYPGALSAEVTYRVDGDGRLTLDYRATTTASTIVAFTNHAFWNLAGSGTIDDHRLALNAARVLACDEELIPRGPPAGVAGTRLDYRAPRQIGDARIDDCFVLDDPTWAAELFEPSTGRRMRVVTDQPGLAVYSGDGLAGPRAGLCLQTGAFPDAPNRADFPSARLDPGMTHRHSTTHAFSR
ncbi:Aldose 1-epimerase [Sorangium cellulosum So ce56]|uniref:Aldose 1-epimerase n=1 Tax=Sorangium cellulosum (strain So ce56) TaxID=448385 RepID=A9FN19_SORC5|nr:aldose epimerase family protein [Sorangium cellulosum]CAN98383.1 Aldose 1-epimerase [Sorangium cellulosum So ce56]